MALLMLVYLTPGPHTVRGLARLLGVSKPVVTRALNTLGGLGYLRRERDQDDRRNVFVVRTNDGANFLEGFKRYLGAGAGDGRRQPVEERRKEPAFAAR
jgi:DNA-binding MarR family transcriptional regulator